MKLLLIGLLATLPASAASPSDPVPVQGALSNSAGPVTDGQYKLRFALWSASSAGVLVWSEVHVGVSVTDGIFSARLGAVETLPEGLFKDNPSLWLAISVESEPDLPRQPLSAVPWAQVANYAHASGSAGGLTCTGCVTASQLAPGAVTSVAVTAVGWAQLVDVPPGFADGVDDIGLTGIGTSGALAAFAVDGSLTGSTVVDVGGLVGVGTPGPVVRLDVAGAVRVGTTTADCTVALSGAIRFDAATKRLQVCDGTTWSGVAADLSANRRTLAVFNGNPYGVSQFQVRVDAATFVGTYGSLFVVTDSNGATVPFCFEQSNGECGPVPTSVVWLRLPTAAAAATTTFTFQQALVGGVRPPSEVFDFYEDFNLPLDLTRWQLATDTCSPSVSGGELRGIGANSNNAECGVMSTTPLLSDGKQLEARLTIGTGTTDADAAVLAVRSDFVTTASHGQVSVGWVIDDEGPTETLVAGNPGSGTSFATTPMRGTTSNVSVHLLGGQVRVCQAIDGKCSGFGVHPSDRDRAFVGSTAFGGIPWSYDWVIIRKTADNPLTASWQ